MSSTESLDSGDVTVDSVGTARLVLLTLAGERSLLVAADDEPETMWDGSAIATEIGERRVWP